MKRKTGVITMLILGLALVGALFGSLRAFMGDDPRCAGGDPHVLQAGAIEPGTAKEVGVPGKLLFVSEKGPQFDEKAPCATQPIGVVNSVEEGLLALYLRDPMSGCNVALVETGDEIPGLGPDARFYDPCHGASFSLEGACSDTPTGPCVRGLTRFQVESTGGDYAVDLRRPHPGKPTSLGPTNSPPPASPVAEKRAAEAVEVVDFLRGLGEFEQLRLAPVVTLRLADEGGGTRVSVESARLKDPNNWQVRSGSTGMNYSFVPPQNATGPYRPA